MKKYIILITLSLSFIIDQVVKFIIVSNLKLAESINVIPNFFRLTYVENTGAAWSILEQGRILFIIITLCALIFLIYYIFKNNNIKKLEMFFLGLLIGGILGNLIDRIRLGYVIDYLDFNFFSYAFPIFNIADICIVVSGLFYLISWILEDVK